MKKMILNFLLIIFFVSGVSLLLYPAVSNYINSLSQSRAIVNYVKEVSDLTTEKYEEFIQKAREYNKKLSDKTNQYKMTEEEINEYNTLLNITSDRIISYVDIPKIGCSLPIYHGTDEVVLQRGVGHIEWTSLPVGGESTHAVLSGHRGLPSAKLFSNLDKLKEGDVFVVKTLNEELTYQVDQIHIVEPKEVDELTIEEGKDYCTLVTCTPYGVNSHRLLVRGIRTENNMDVEYINVTSDATQIDTIIMAAVLGVPVFLLLYFVILINRKRKVINL